MSKVIGIDVRPLQNDHKYRGVGEVVRQTLPAILVRAAQDGYTIIFYRYDTGKGIKDIIKLPKKLNYGEVVAGVDPLYTQRSVGQKFKDALAKNFGTPLPSLRGVDIFLQYDYSLGVPAGKRTVLVKHDIIPIVFRDKFFTSPWVHFKNRAARTMLRTTYHNWSYMHILRRSLRRARKVVTVSDHTGRDLHAYMRVPHRKMKTVHLGVEGIDHTDLEVETDKLPNKPYLLFVGAADAQRRSLEDLVGAYNNLRADGNDIQLVLAGENFQSEAYIKKILPKDLSDAILKSSYGSDILKLGYINNATKSHLYRHAIAFVMPTRYEGFGIPVLEAMVNNCPVIVYKNSSIPEVAGDAALYARDWLDIYMHASRLLVIPKKERQKLVEQAQKHAAMYTWEKTADKLYRELVG